MHNNLQLDNLVQQLKLSGISDSLESRLRQAKDGALSYEELLSMLLQDELDNRYHTSLQRRINQAKFEELKTFEGLDMNRYPLKIRHAINKQPRRKQRGIVRIIPTGDLHIVCCISFLGFLHNCLSCSHLHAC